MAKRNFGLDIVRSIAILLVIVAHATLYLGDQTKYISDLVVLFGLYGVELFFVLSGFLIGQIIVKDLLPNLNKKRIMYFYIKQWFRTLPAYYVVLIILIICEWINGVHPFHWKHFLFIQNFDPKEISFFAASWSLTVEEWFYFILPLTFLLFLPKKYRKTNILNILIFSMIFILCARICYVLFLNPTFDFGVRKFVPLRLDSLLFGVLLAHIKINYQKVYSYLQNFWIPCFSILTLVVLDYIWIYSDPPIDSDHNFFMRVFSWLIISIAMLLVIPFFENNDFINQKLKNNGIFFHLFSKISLYSYSLYLIHYEFYKYVFEICKINQGVFSVLVTTGIIFILSAVLFYSIEKPMLDLRDRFFDGKKPVSIKFQFWMRNQAEAEAEGE